MLPHLLALAAPVLAATFGPLLLLGLLGRLAVALTPQPSGARAPWRPRHDRVLPGLAPRRPAKVRLAGLRTTPLLTAGALAVAMTALLARTVWG